MYSVYICTSFYGHIYIQFILKKCTSDVNVYNFVVLCPCSAIRKINELVKRIRTCKVHAYIIGHLKEQMPMLMGHAKKQKQVHL